MSDFINLFEQYSNSVSALCAVFALIGAAISVIVQHLIKRKSNAMDENIKLKEEIEKLRKEIVAYKSLADIENDLVKNDDCLFWKSKGMFICRTCWYKDKKTIPLTDESGSFRCLICGDAGAINAVEHERYVRSWDDIYENN